MLSHTSDPDSTVGRTAALPTVVHNDRKGLNAATKRRAKNANLCHLLFIRHAESSNNVLAEEITKEMGVNPYNAQAAKEVLAAYDKKRLCDPHLSRLGERQAELLPRHPHLIELGMDELAAVGRVRIVTSPMQRAILTSIPLIKTYKLPRALLKADVCEKGGSYTTTTDPDTGVHTNTASPGLGRSQLAERWSETHDASEIREDGWWHTTCTGAEDAVAFEERLIRAIRWIREEVDAYAQDPSRPDYLIVVSHADFHLCSHHQTVAAATWSCAVCVLRQEYIHSSYRIRGE